MSTGRVGKWFRRLGPKTRRQERFNSSGWSYVWTFWIPVAVGVVIVGLSIAVSKDRTPWIVASMAIVFSWLIAQQQTESRKKHEKRVEALLKDILNTLKCESRLADQDGHHTTGCDSDGQQERKTMTDQCRGCRKADKPKGQDKGWLDAVMNTIPRALAFFALTVLMFVVTAGIWSLAGDHSVWGNEVTLGLLAATSAVMVGSYKGRSEDKCCRCPHSGPSGPA